MIELASLPIVLLLIFVGLRYFGGSLKKIAKEIDYEVTASVTEDMKDIIRRTQEAKQDIIDEFGEDFETPDDVYNFLTKKRKSKKRFAQ